jgi:hypothetical protein
MKEIVDGVFQWKAMHPDVGSEVGLPPLGGGEALRSVAGGS